MNDRIKIVSVREQIGRTNDWRVELLSRRVVALLPGDLHAPQPIERNQLLAVFVRHEDGNTIVEKIVRRVSPSELRALVDQIRETSAQRFTVYDATFKRFNRANDYGFAAKIDGGSDIHLPGHALRRSGLAEYIFAPSQKVTVLASEGAKGAVAVWIGVGF